MIRRENPISDIGRDHTLSATTRTGVRGRSYQQAGFDKDARRRWQGAGLEMSAHIVADVRFWHLADIRGVAHRLGRPIQLSLAATSHSANTADL
jgi:hypothetical protein